MSKVHKDLDEVKLYLEKARSILDRLYYSSGEFRIAAKPAINMIIKGIEFAITNIPLIKEKTINPE